MDATHRSMVYIALGIFVGVALVNDRPQGASSPAASPAELALGDSVFHGRVGGALCYVCHGQAGKGVSGLGPDLTDHEWVNGDGTLAFIEKVVEEGIAKTEENARTDAAERRRAAHRVADQGGGVVRVFTRSYEEIGSSLSSLA